MRLRPGTPCYLVGLAEMTELIGRVVEVESGPFTMADKPDLFYRCSAPWVREMFQGRDLIAPLRTLQPLRPPRIALPGTRRGEGCCGASVEGRRPIVHPLGIGP